MRYNKIWVILLFTTLAISVRGAFPYKEPKHLSKQMAYERDVFLLDCPEGIQDKERRAVERAVKGDVSELCKMRERTHSRYSPSAGVEIMNMTLGYENFVIADGGIKARLYRPKCRKESRRLPLLVYLHGGGWVFGNIESCADFCDALASTGEIMVLAVDYRLAPENTFPIPIEDAMSALYYAFRMAEEWGSEIGLVSVGGDGSGGNLAIMSALGIANATDKANKKMKVKSVVTIDPVLKVFEDHIESWEKYGECYGLDSDLLGMCFVAYLSGIGKPDDRKVSELELQASPCYVVDSILSRLPEFLLIASGRNLLSDQGALFVEQVRALGVKAERIEFKEACHHIVSQSGQTTSMREAVKCIKSFLVAD